MFLQETGVLQLLPKHISHSAMNVTNITLQ